MVYCTYCGTKNDESSEVCTKCGAKLNVTKNKTLEKRIEEGAEEICKRAEEWGENIGKRAEAWGENFEKRTQEDCFGLPHSGTIFGLIIGFIILLVGLSWLAGIDLNLWPIMIIIFGVLILAGTLTKLLRKR